MPIEINRRSALIAAAGLGGAGLLAGGVIAPAAAEPGPGGMPRHDLPLTDLGEPVHKTQTLSSAITTLPDGTPLGVYVGAGNSTTNAELAVTDLRTQETVLHTRLPHGVGTQRAIAVSPLDDAVYFGMSSEQGHLYRYRPGAEEVEHLGQAPVGQTVWGLGIGEDGTVWFGSYPGGRLFSLGPESLAIHDHGVVKHGEQYVNAILPTADLVYVGTQQQGFLVTYDPANGQFAEIGMPASDTATGIAALEIRGDLLFMSSNGIHVRDQTIGEWVDHLPGANSRVSPVSPTDPDAVYARVDGAIQRYDLRTRQLSSTGWAPNATAESWTWIDYDGTGPFLALTYWNQGRTYGRNFEQRTGFYLVPGLEGAGAQIISLGAGPEGAIYAGAYLSPPGSGRYDPDEEGFELLAGSGQVEGFGTYGDTVVFGRYPQASLWRFDPSRPWELNSNPAAPIELDHEQSRPQKFLELTSIPGTVAVTSVPTGGVHGGAVTLWQPEDGTLFVHRHVVQDQTPVSLLEVGDLIIGGTSIEGGYGIDPVTAEAHLFALDPSDGTVLWQWAPVPGATTLTALTLDEEAHLWGIASGSLAFEVDSETRETLRTIEVAPGYGGDRYGSAERLLLDHGRLLGASGNSLFLIDRITGEVVDLLDNVADRPSHVSGLAQDRYGDLYLVGAATHLLRIAWGDDVEAPGITVSARPSSPAPGRSALVRLRSDDPGARIDYRIDDGEWGPYSRPFTAAGGQRVECRAIDPSWNSSVVEVLQL